MSINKKYDAIYIDMDSVLVENLPAMLELFGVEEYLGNPAWVYVRTWDGMAPLISRILGYKVSEQDFWNKIDEAGEDLWANFPWTWWGKDLYELCQKHTDAVVLMSAPTSHPSSASGKLKWINSQMPHEWRRRYSLSPCKHHMAHPGALLIDDGVHNIEKFQQHGGDTFLWKMPWNCNENAGRWIDGTIIDEMMEKLREKLRV